jgi:23S rRNA (adenine2503-C2)-methyltransferase
VQLKLKKGKQQASQIYRSWFRQGKLDESLPIFANCSQLFHDICSLVDFSYPKLSCLKNFDTTQKFLLQTADLLEYESVIIPMNFGSTLCVSSQVGCKMGCTFCQTGKMGLVRHLSVEEIVAQLFVARFELKTKIRNIVFMGMGEPFDNFEVVNQVIDIFIDPYAFNLAPSKVTVSTSGRVDGIVKLMERKGPPINLAVSVNASCDEKRRKIMPVNRQWGMHELKFLLNM